VRELAEGFAFTEGPAVAPDGRIYFSDIPKDRIHVHDPETGRTSLWKEGIGNSNGLAFDASGALITCEKGARRIGRHDLASGDYRVLVETFEGRRFNQPNDLALDRDGGIFFTDPIYGNAEAELDCEGIYYLAGDTAQTRRVDRTCKKPNGIALSHDGATLYVVDNGAGELITFDVVRQQDPGPRLAGRRLLSRLGPAEQAAGDGMTLDAAGRLFVTVPGAIAVFDPSGEQLARLALPENPTNCCFGRGDDRATLYITARTGFYAVEVSPGGAP
jgi:sugar lactone lactonase YvrE